MLPLVSMARFDDQPAEAPKAEPLSRTPAAKRFIANDPTYQAAVTAYAAAPARKKAAHRLKMIETLQAALREYHRRHPLSPAAEKTKQAELAAANEVYVQRPRQPIHIEYSEALNDGPAEST
jgi:predicted naringenin-chalcone synthase